MGKWCPICWKNTGSPEQPIFGSRPQSTARAEPKHWGCSPFSQRKNPVLLGDLDSYYLLTLEGSDSSIQIFAIQPGGPRWVRGGPHLHGGDMQVCLIDTMRACMSVVNTASGAQHWINSCYSCSSGEGNGYPLQYSWLANPMERGAWWAMVHGAAKSRTRLKQLSMRARAHTHTHTHTFIFKLM